MGARGEELLVGGLCLVLALVNAWRLATALRRDEVPLYRTRLHRAGLGAGKYGALVALHVGLCVLLLVMAADLLFSLGLRGH